MKGVGVMGACQTMKISGKPSGNPWHYGLVALSLLSGGWLLGYGLSPSMTGWTDSPMDNANNGKCCPSVPAYRQGFPNLNEKQRTRKNASASWSITEMTDGKAGRE
jgi:hypothetical protein